MYLIKVLHFCGCKPEKLVKSAKGFHVNVLSLSGCFGDNQKHALVIVNSSVISSLCFELITQSPFVTDSH